MESGVLSIILTKKSPFSYLQQELLSNTQFHIQSLSYRCQVTKIYDNILLLM